MALYYQIYHWWGVGRKGGLAWFCPNVRRKTLWIDWTYIHVGPITNLSGDRALTLTLIFQGRDIFCPEGPGLSVDLEEKIFLARKTLFFQLNARFLTCTNHQSCFALQQVVQNITLHWLLPQKWLENEKLKIQLFALLQYSFCINCQSFRPETYLTHIWSNIWNAFCMNPLTKINT